MRYAVCYRPDTVHVMAYVHVEPTGLVRAPLGAEVQPAPAHTVRTPDPWLPNGPGPEGTYHA